MTSRLLLSFLTAAVFSAATAQEYPATAGLLNVRDYGAVGDGVADDTQAIQKALTAGVDGHAIVYLPAGTYLVSDTLRWKHDSDEGPSRGWGRFLELRGAGSELSMIVLQDSAPGFTDAAKPKAVIQTGSSGTHGNKQYSNGEGNEAFMNHLRDFAVHIGAGNAGAIGVDFQASNSGAMRNIILRAAPDAGLIGINLCRRDNGPGLLSHVDIDGFAIGVRGAQEICQFSGEFLRFRNQREVVIDAQDVVFALRKIDSTNTVPALRVSGVANVTVLDSTFGGPASAGPAMVVAGENARLLLRDVTTSGYATGIDQRGTAVKTGKLSLWNSDALLMAFPDTKPATRIKVMETPEPPLPAPDTWADIGPANGTDDTAAIEAALAGGKPVVFFRHGGYRIAHTITIPRHVRWLMGLGTTLDISGKVPLPDNGPVFVLSGGRKTDVTVIDAFWAELRGGTFVRHEDARTAVLRDICFIDARVYANTPGAGPLFVEDVAGAGYDLSPGTRVYARQWNMEGGDPNASLDGAQAWGLGFKCEGAHLILDMKNQAVVEAYGGLMYTFGADQRPAFTSRDSTAFLNFSGSTYMPDGFYKVLLREQRGEVSKELSRDAAPVRGGGRAVVGIVVAP